MSNSFVFAFQITALVFVLALISQTVGVVVV